MIVDCALYREGRRTEPSRDFSAALREARSAADAFLWIGLHEPTEEEFGQITQDFGLHPLAVEDALRAHQRPKLEIYTGSLFLVLKPVAYEGDDGGLVTGEVMVFVGDSFVLTVRHGRASPLGAVRTRLEEDPGVLRHGPSAVMYAVADAVVDHYLDVAAALHTDLDELEAGVFATNSRVGADTASRIYEFKRRALEFRRATMPLADPVTRLTGAGVPFVHKDALLFFRDVADHLSRVNEQVESIDRLLTDILSAYLAQMGVRQNDDMRKISAWAAMFAVPTAIAGVYGMNFDHMPELHWVWSYPAVILLMLTVCVVLFRVFKRRGWL
ncbi:magnesium/cobalt transporter CorA [Streptomyces axinellae]|uniref:Magnesium transport protein CorA n=1 Tax=Streptomyces axinellae TaxID=552788 RepID=A0ABP6BZA6_9ACTN